MNISVILPTYNRIKYLQKIIDSVFNQTYSEGEIELIIIDDNSSDGTEEYILSLANNKIKYIKNKTNKGGAYSRNIGVQNANYDYIAFIDSDTIWYKNKLSKQISLLINNPEKIIYCCYRKQRRGKWLLQPKDIFDGQIFENLIFQNFIDTPSSIMKKELFLSVGGFDEDLPRFQDWDLFLRLAQQYDFVGIKEPLFDSLTLRKSITTNDKSRIIALEIIFEKYKSYILKNNLLSQRFIIKIVNANLILNDFYNCRKIICNNDVKFSLKIKLYLLVFIFSFLPNNSYKNLYSLR
ncbi:MAG: hypothetical protein CMD14_09665 [Flavobacteriales bacterium]|nr:hypothetical protein [Flavobacteriales bacterium]|tara:strand:+ start:19447 stop:20328 length:882 start_codon:yes stop_codon:yes gene_type:complete